MIGAAAPNLIQADPPHAVPDMNQATGRFLLLMASLSPVDLAITGIFVAVSERKGVFGLDLIANVAIFGLLNVALSYRLFRPIARNLGSDESKRAASGRIHALPRLAALQAAGLAILYCGVVTYLGVFNLRPAALRELDEVYVLSALLWYGAIYALYYSFYIYFLINDYLYWLRPHLVQSGLPVPPAGRRIRTKLLAIFFVVAVTPTVLAILDLTFFREIRAAQGLTLSQQIFFDLMASAFVITVSFIFVSRSLLRPVNTLMAAMAKLGQGDLDTRAPITADDELGVLTERFNAMTEGLRERAYIRETFGRYVPESIAAALVAGRGALEPALSEATILFTDIAGFTRMAETAPPRRVVLMLNEYFAAVTEPVARYGGVINQFQGDAMLVTFNVPVADPSHADHAVLAALGILRATRGRLFAGFSIETRAGINTGEVLAGPVGSADRLNYTVHGDAVNMAARLEQLNKKLATRILISQTTMDKISDNYRVRSMGTVALRGKRQRVAIHSVDGYKGSDEPQAPLGGHPSPGTIR